MAGWGERLKGLLGGKPKAVPKKTPSSKTYKAPSNRAEMIAAAMDIHQRGRAHAQGVLEKALKDLQAKPPKPSDVEGMTRLLTLRQAVLGMKGNLAHDEKRQKVLAGLKGLMESDRAPGGRPEPSAPAKDPARRPPSQGAKR